MIPPVPVRQWVISVPKRLRWFLADRPEAVTALTTIFLGEIERLLREAAGMSHAENEPPSARPRFGAVSFLHRFGSALNRHVHLHTCVTDGVFTRSPEGVAFVPARPISPADLEALTERVRHRVVCWFRRRGLIDAKAAADMLAWENSGFSIDSSVRISLTDRDVPGYFQSLEHLVRYCARPAFALERLCRIEARDGRPERIRYVLPRHKRGTWIGPGRSRKSSAPDARGVIHLSPHELLDRLADLIPPPRKHRHRYHGVFAPNHPLRATVTALAIGNASARPPDACQASSPPRPPGEGRGEGAGEDKPRSHDTSRLTWATLLARIGERFPLECPNCGGDIRLVAFITDPGPIRRILTHVGEPLEPPPLAPARGPPTAWPELVQSHDDGDVVQASPDELPVIDIHAI